MKISRLRRGVSMNQKTDFGYSKKTTTAICYEKPSKNNPFVAESIHLFGYDLLELTKKKSFIEVLLLLYTGELPTPNSTELMNTLMIGLINPGPRNPAVRAAMTAGISKSNPPHLLPIGLMVLGGVDGGAAEVEKSMQLIQRSFTSNKKTLFSTNSTNTSMHEGDIKIAPGFGSSYGQKCIVTHQLAQHLINRPGAGKYLHWVNEQLLNSNDDRVGWLPVGLASATFLDLGIQPREGIALFQILYAPGISAHALEQTHKPISSMPFLEDSQYELK